jgi:lipopolysaccharide export system permease protein
MKLATLATLLTLVVNVWVQPYCAREMRRELFRIRTDLAAALVKPGEFTQPAPGLTFYVQQVEQGGLLKNVFIYQENPVGGSTTYTARSGLLTKRRGMPVLLLRNGSSEGFNSAGVLNYLAFDEYTVDLGSYIKADDHLHYKTADRYLHELVLPDLSQVWERRNRVSMLSEAHYRLSSPLYSITFMSLALWAVLGGAFTRLGYGSRVARAAFAAMMVRILGFGVQAACAGLPALNVLQYLLPLGAAAWALRGVFRGPAAARLRFRPYPGQAVPPLAEARS